MLSEKDLVQKVKMLIITIRKKKKKHKTSQLIRRPEKVVFMPVMTVEPSRKSPLLAQLNQWKAMDSVN